MSALIALAAPYDPKSAITTNGDAWVLGATAVGGVAGTLLWKEHPVLGLLDGFAVGGNVARMALKKVSVRRGAENLGAHIVATAGSLSMPKYPALGYVAGVVTSNLFLRRNDSFIQRFDEAVLGEGHKPEPKMLGGVSGVVGVASDLAVSGAADSMSVVKQRPAWQLVLAGLLATAVGAGIISAVRR